MVFILQGNNVMDYEWEYKELIRFLYNMDCILPFNEIPVRADIGEGFSEYVEYLFKIKEKI